MVERRTLLIAAVGVAVVVTAGFATAVARRSGRSSCDDLPRGSEQVALDPEDFTIDIDNPYWPMAAGSRWVYHESEPDEGIEQDIVVTVTGQTKTVAGVETRVVHEVTTTDEGEQVEVTDDWYAQDTCGNVWYFGEQTREHEAGEEPTTKGSWEAGVEGAQPGIAIPAHPEPGLAYRQEYAQGEAEDQGVVLSIDEEAEVPFGHFDGAVLTKDFTPLEPDIVEYKLYAKDVGPVLAIGISGGADRAQLTRYARG